MRSSSKHARTRIAQAEALFDDYRKRRLTAGVWDARQRMVTADTKRSLVGFREIEVDEIGERKHRWCPNDKAAVLSPDLSSWQWGLFPAERLLLLLQADLRKRVKDYDGSAHRCEGRTALRAALAAVSECQRATLAVMEAVWKQQSQDADAINSAAWVARRINEVFNETRVPQVVGEQIQRAAGAYLHAVRAVGDSTWATEKDLVSYCLAVEVLTYAFAPPYESVEPVTPKFTFLRLGPDRLGELFNTDGFRELEDGRKLYGTRLGHCGSFLHESWRDSDYTWGRLDAAHHLLRILLPPNERRERERRLQEAILTSCFKQDGRARMVKHLNELKKTSDQDLLRSQAQGQEQSTLIKTWESVLDLLGPAKLPSRAPDSKRTKPHLEGINLYARAALGWLDKKDPSVPRLPWKARLLRFFTRHLRKGMSTDPTWSGVREGLKKDLRMLRRGLFFLLCLLTGLAGLAIALLVILIWFR
jgi:hypothetical protein